MEYEKTNAKGIGKCYKCLSIYGECEHTKPHWSEFEIKKLKEQNAALAAQVEELQLCLKERKAVCHQAFDANDALKAERDALAAQVEVLQSTAAKVVTGDAEISELEPLLDATPQQHLAERDAQKGWDGFIAGYHKMHIEFVGSLASSEGAEFAANQYADSIRQGVK